MDRNNAVVRKLGGIGTSLSARRAWIEMEVVVILSQNPASLSARRAWIEIGAVTPMQIGIMSLSARRAWIEIVVEYKRAKEKAVALRKESVDRNSAKTIRRDIASMPVALRKESVDRNFQVRIVTG